MSITFALKYNLTSNISPHKKDLFAHDIFLKRFLGIFFNMLFATFHLIPDSLGVRT